MRRLQDGHSVGWPRFAVPLRIPHQFHTQTTISGTVGFKCRCFGL
jgi:hypothetical protein